MAAILHATTIVWVDEADTFKEIGCDEQNLHF